MPHPVVNYVQFIVRKRHVPHKWGYLDGTELYIVSFSLWLTSETDMCDPSSAVTLRVILYCRRGYQRLDSEIYDISGISELNSSSLKEARNWDVCMESIQDIMESYADEFQ